MISGKNSGFSVARGKGGRSATGLAFDIAPGGPSRRARAAVADRATSPPAGGLAGPWSLTCGGLVTALRNTVIDTADGTTRRWL